MSNIFNLATPGDIRFGAGRSSEVADALASLGVRRVMVVTGANPARFDNILATLREAGLGAETFPVSGEPSVDLIREGVAAVKFDGSDGVLGVGGGSVIDAAKAIAALAASGTDPLDHLEVVGQGQPLTTPSLPCVAVPTTAGTGSEVTRNSVLSEGQVKASLRSPHMLPKVSVVDPDLLVGLPARTIASSGSDALSQLIEPYLSAKANPLTDALALAGIGRSVRSLRRAVQQGLDDDPESREDLAMASLFGGLCLANSGLGAVHGFAAVLGARYAAPHGAICGALLPAAVGVNLSALRAREPEHRSVERIGDVAVALTGEVDAAPEAAEAWLRTLRDDIGVPGLSAYDIPEDDFAAIVEQGRKASSMKGNPIELTDEELTEILARSL